VFTGRSRRSEYWYFQLFNILIGIAIVLVFAFLGGVVAGITGNGEKTAEAIAQLAYSVFALGTLLPALGVLIRRLHDTDRSGWWVLLGLVPFIGGIVLIVFCVQDSQPGSNQYGPNPKEAVAAAPVLKSF
jgi:uncharacterized membrane protein YhaH (DUF805 family)